MLTESGSPTQLPLQDVDSRGLRREPIEEAESFKMDVETAPAGVPAVSEENGSANDVLSTENNDENGGDETRRNVVSDIQSAPAKPATAEEENSTNHDSGATTVEGIEHGGDRMNLGDVKAAAEEIDGNLDDAIGHAADSIWSFATSVTDRVTSVVKDGPSEFDNLRKNVTSRLAPLDHIGRDLSSHIGALAPKENAIANFTGSVKSVAETVQRNAQAMEAAILAKANAVESTEPSREVSANGTNTDGMGESEVAVGDPAMGVLPLMSVRDNDDPQEVIDVNEEIARVGETISNSFVAQTVGDLWTGLWGSGGGNELGDDAEAIANVPKTRFEKRIFELEANPDTYCEPAKDLDAFEQWSKSFVLDDYAERCIAILDRHVSIAELYERVVPRIVEEETFWMRYFFARHVLEKEEERRKRLLERAENTVAEGEDDEDGWGDDDWDDDTEVQAESAPAQGKNGDAVETSKAVDAEIPTFTEDENKDSPKLDAGSAESSAKAEQSGKPKTEASKSADTAAPAKPVSQVQVVPTPGDDWGDDDWE